ncbi:hypothetical protein N7449_005796 [Penicillium cf. viridicatum]|uniref:Uncharacterized protein n=1 Tax=Penicillium cf. viridicatum TaxID=2972119 RepID=A0A9W9MGP5_9EURO|nr:hypothetical protein N7449_005796 [Penicillium cf. viridicatum]
MTFFISLDCWALNISCPLVWKVYRMFSRIVPINFKRPVAYADTQSAFSRQVDKLKPILSSKASQIVQHVPENCVSDNEKGAKFATINVNEFAKLISQDVMGIIALGIDFNSILGQNLEIFDVFQTLFSSNDHKKSHFMWHNSAPPSLVTMFPSKIDRQMETAYRQLRKSLEQLIPEKLASLKSTDLSDQDILTQIACSGDFTQEEIIPQIVTTLAAGFESTASSLSWTLYAANPEAQNNLRQELHEAKSTKNALSEEYYEKLPLLNGVCSEASRLFPTFAMTLRKEICDTYISGRLVQAGTYIAIVPRAINRAKHYGAMMQSNLRQRGGLTDPTLQPLKSTQWGGGGGLLRLYVCCRFFMDPGAALGDL